MQKIIALFILGFIIVACANSGKKNASAGLDGEKIFKTNCVLCHGEDGKLGLNNSKDLTISKLTKEERVAIITNGKNAMTGFGTLLSEEEIQAVADYTFKLK